MTNFDEILIRLGVDAKAVTSGLGRVTSFVKGWAIGLGEDLKSGIIGRFAGIYLFKQVFDFFKNIGEEAVKVRRAMRETGLGSDFVQDISDTMEEAGQSTENFTKPLRKLNVLIGEAKQGSDDARKKLMQWGIATKEQDFKTLDTEKALRKIKDAYDNLGTSEERAAMLNKLFGKGYADLIPVLELSADKFNEMGRSSFFTNFTPGTLDIAKAFKQGTAQAWDTLKSTTGNILAFIPSFFLRLSQLPELGKKTGESGEGFFSATKHMLSFLAGFGELQGEAKDAVNKTTMALENQLNVMERQNEIQKLNNQLLDRNKLTVGQLADRARDILGTRGMARGLSMIHTITPAMASALKIQNLEDSAQMAVAMGRQGLAEQFQSQADSLRKSNLALKSTERDPMEQVNLKLAEIEMALTQSGIVIKDMQQVQNH